MKSAPKKLSLLIIAGDARLTQMLARAFAGYGCEAVVFGASEALLHDPAALRAAFARLPLYGQMVVLPGMYLYKRFLDTSDVEWDALLERNFERATWAAQAYAHAQIAAGIGGSIVFVSSMAATMPFVDMSALGTSLAALRALARMAAVDLAPHDINVNMLECGWSGDVSAHDAILDAAGERHIKAGTPSGRLIRVDEMAAACGYLRMARSVTGTVLTLDGGYSITRSPGESPLPPLLSLEH
jgi:NAD(P)-dependent dehydrogenase (short-subunit alcohol dehydrogenase family)